MDRPSDRLSLLLKIRSLMRHGGPIRIGSLHPKTMRINVLILSCLVLLATPALSGADKRTKDKSFAEVKEMKLMYLKRMTACVVKASSFEEMKNCRPKRRSIGKKPEA